MSMTLGEARAEARRFLWSGDYARALRAYDRILASVPLDYEVRFKIADVLAKSGLGDEAAEVYRAVALHDIRTGHPLPAIVACAALDKLGYDVQPLHDLLTATYASGSQQLARFAVRQAPISLATPVADLDFLASEAFDVVAERARRRAADLSAFADHQEPLHPLPFFSELGREPFLAMLKSLKVHRLSNGAVVTQQGEPGDALYLVAAGEVRVFVAENGTEREVARLYENTLFGEMALVTGQPRSASVAVVEEADVIEVSREALARITAELPVIKEVLDRFSRERLIKNLLQTSPLFTPFSKAQQSDLLRRFEGHDVEAGTEVIREGEVGLGLFVVLAGELQVGKRGPEGTLLPLGRLGTGDICGEMSLLSNQPTTATVRAVTRTTLLFLARSYVEKLAEAIPQVHDYFHAVAARRDYDNRLRLRGNALPEETELDPTEAPLL
jgi:CRP-like cAMP-binding protein